jgi:glycosyltransferase involved in cell wall biosynthesis
MNLKPKLLILIAPNVTEQMGGEGMKALQIFQELCKVSDNVVQITHARNAEELTERLQVKGIYFVPDSSFSLFINRFSLSSLFLNWWFSVKAVSLAERLAKERGFGRGDVVIWQTEPNSPVQQRALSKLHPNVFGPLNGNIYYPKIFSAFESSIAKIRRLLHGPLQTVNKFLFRSMPSADLLLVAGGARTRDSLLRRGCSLQKMADSLDCGIRDELFLRDRVAHVGKNPRFVHFRAGNFHKGTFLLVHSLAKADIRITVDVIGQGPDIEICRQLADDLGVGDRIRFLGWFDSHAEMLDSLKQYRGYILPTIEDANGIAVQEAMALGLPPICLDWGGPQLLIDHGQNGFLIKPISIEQISTEIAEHMHTLASDSELAEAMSVRGREKAFEWRWSVVVNDWLNLVNAVR